MKSKINILLVIVLLLSSCIDSTLDTAIDNVVKKENKEIIYSFSTHIPEHEVISTRSGADITGLQLLVFDENGRFLSRTKAIMEGTQNIGGVVVRNFKAILLSSDQKRFIHFIANYDGWNTFPPTHEILNADEGSIVPILNSANTVYWNRFEFNNLQESSFTNRRFPLLRNKAKVGLINEATNFTVSQFALYNAPAMGTVAPFKFNDVNNSFTFTEGTLTQVSPVGLVAPQFINLSTTQSIELFEKDNEETGDKVFIVVKGKLVGATSESYFKLDIVKDQNNGALYDIIRNRIYQFTIKSVAATASGYATPDEAAINPASNNLMGSVELKDYPSISDGVSYLKVAKLAEVFIMPGTFETQIDYFRNLNNTATFPGSVEVELVTPNPNNDIVVSYNSTTGKLKVIVNRVPTDRVITHSIRVRTKTTENNGLMRYITVVLRSPYNFNFGVVNKGSRIQNNGVEVSFDVPGTIPLNVFPIAIYFETKELYPDPAYMDLNVDIDNKKYRYEYKIKESDRGKRVTLYFKRTYSNRTETIPVVCQYILPGATIILN